MVTSGMVRLVREGEGDNSDERRASGAKATTLPLPMLLLSCMGPCMPASLERVLRMLSSCNPAPASLAVLCLASVESTGDNSSYQEEEEQVKASIAAHSI